MALMSRLLSSEYPVSAVERVAPVVCVIASNNNFSVAERGVYHLTVAKSDTYMTVKYNYVTAFDVAH